MIFLTIVGAFTIAFLGPWAIGELVIFNFNRRLKKTIKKSREEWKKDQGRLKEVYVTEENYVDERVKEYLDRVNFVEEKVE